MYKSIIAILSLFLIFAAYIQLPDLTQYDSKRVLQLSVLFSIGILFLILIFKSFLGNRTLPVIEPPDSRGFYTCVAILFFAGGISVLLASNFQSALLEFAFFFLLFALAIVLSPSNSRQHYFLGKLIFVTALIFSGLYVVIFLGNYISSFFNPLTALWPDKVNFSLIVNGIELTGKEVLFFDHKRFFNHTQTWTLPILIGLLTYGQQKGWNITNKVLLFALISIWWALLIASGGRGTLVGVIAPLIILFILYRNEISNFFKISIATLFTGWITYFLMSSAFTEGPTQDILRTESSRLFRWGGALEVWWQNPFFGIGPMHYAEIGKTQFVGHPHNFYLQFLSEWGIFAFIALSCLLIRGLCFINKNCSKTSEKSTNRVIYLTFAWSVLAAFTHSFVSGVMMTPMSQMWLVLIMAWFIGYKRREVNVDNWPINLNHVKIAYLVFLIIIIFLVYDDALNLTNSYAEYLTKYPNTKFYPRFWGQGLF